jgi:hypothetical protein
VVVVNWKPNFEDQWAVVLFDEGEQAILEAFTHVSEELVVPEFRWAYQPRKRDGRNEERKARFVEALGETTIRLPVPVSAEQLTGFIDAATRIADTRRHAQARGVPPETRRCWQLDLSGEPRLLQRRWRVAVARRSPQVVAQPARSVVVRHAVERECFRAGAQRKRAEVERHRNAAHVRPHEGALGLGPLKCCMVVVWHGFEQHHAGRASELCGPVALQARVVEGGHGLRWVRGIDTVSCETRSLTL